MCALEAVGRGENKDEMTQAVVCTNVREEVKIGNIHRKCVQPLYSIARCTVAKYSGTSVHELTYLHDSAYKQNWMKTKSNFTLKSTWNLTIELDLAFTQLGL